MTEEAPSTVVDLEDILTYLQCPLKVRYKIWGAKETLADPRLVVIDAFRHGLRTLMTGLVRDGRKRAKSSFAAIHAYETRIKHYVDTATLKDDTASWYIYGVELLRSFDLSLNPSTDVPIVGYMPDMIAKVGDIYVRGHIDGLISYNGEVDADAHYGIVHVHKAEKPRPPWEVVQEGFLYAAARQATAGLRSYPMMVVRLDPFNKTLTKVPISQRDNRSFEALVLAAHAGITNGVFVPQPSKAMCGRCSFENVCSLRYARPGNQPWLEREFRNGSE